MNSSHQGATMPKNIHKPRRSFSDLICWITIIAWCLVSISYTLFERLDQTGITTLWCLLPSFLFTNELAPNRSFTFFFFSPHKEIFFPLLTWQPGFLQRLFLLPARPSLPSRSNGVSLCLPLMRSLSRTIVFVLNLNYRISVFCDSSPSSWIGQFSPTGFCSRNSPQKTYLTLVSFFSASAHHVPESVSSEGNLDSPSPSCLPSSPHRVCKLAINLKVTYFIRHSEC